MPLEIAKLPVQLRSDAMRQRARTAAHSAAGGNSAATSRAIRLFFPRLLLTIGPLRKRMRTTMKTGIRVSRQRTHRYQSINFLR